MQPSEIFRLLARRMPMRILIFQVSSLALMASLVMVLVVWHSLSWGIVAFLTSFLCIAAWVLIRQKCIGAWEIAKNPRLVYWAHSRELPRRIARYGGKNCKILTLHLRNGRQCEFILPSENVRKFHDWLNEQNPSVCWDAYYNP
jgi:membrane protein required for beta-lactamase induction